MQPDLCKTCFLWGWSQKAHRLAALTFCRESLRLVFEEARNSIKRCIQSLSATLCFYRELCAHHFTRGRCIRLSGGVQIDGLLEALNEFLSVPYTDSQEELLNHARPLQHAPKAKRPFARFHCFHSFSRFSLIGIFQAAPRGPSKLPQANWPGRAAWHSAHGCSCSGACKTY